MIVVKDVERCRETMLKARIGGNTTGLVPTMGALHEGHLSLIRAARGRCDFTAVSIFVNPSQFGPGEDLDSYPRALDDDLAKCTGSGVDLVFTPSVETMYASSGTTTIHVGGITEGLCGALRPGHFDGVATIVAKLFNVAPADMAFFGEKDYQQLAMIRRMVADLNIPIEIVACPTVRDPSGLALSSRNAYLTAIEREQAAEINRALMAAVERVASGERTASALTTMVREHIASAGPLAIEYVEVVDASSMKCLPTVDRPARICVAVRLGACRLIDNVGVTPREV